MIITGITLILLGIIIFTIELKTNVFYHKTKGRHDRWLDENMKN